MSDQADLFRFLIRNPVPSPIGFETWLGEAAQRALGKGAAQAQEFAGNRKAALFTAFSKYDSELRNRGCSSAFEIIDQRSRIFQSPSTAGSTSLDSLVSSDRAEIVTWIDSLDDRQYEFLGAAALHLLGATKTYVSPSGGDGGVDFYALLPSWGSSGIFYSPHKSLRIVGQSKKYKDPAHKDTAKLLATTVDDIRSLTVEMQNHLPDWFMLSQGPVVGAMFAPRGFQTGAVSRAHRNGVMLADSIDVAETIIGSARYKRRRLAGIVPAQILGEAMLAVGST